VRDLDKESFISRFGSVYEHSSWVAEAVFEQATDDCLDPGTLAQDSLIVRFANVFMAASHDLQMATLQAHPQLACALDERKQLTADSKAEQSGAGLDSCSTDEFVEFARLNLAYVKKFGFPFIIAVKGRKRQEILDVFTERLHNDAEVEFAAAIGEVGQIARFRIEGMFPDV